MRAAGQNLASSTPSTTLPLCIQQRAPGLSWCVGVLACDRLMSTQPSPRGRRAAGENCARCACNGLTFPRRPIVRPHGHDIHEDQKPKRCRCLLRAGGRAGAHHQGQPRLSRRRLGLHLPRLSRAAAADAALRRHCRSAPCTASAPCCGSCCSDSTRPEARRISPSSSTPARRRSATRSTTSTRRTGRRRPRSWSRSSR